ncbi:MAG: DUF6786 family protein [Bryobacteraceae bacterium]
MTYDTLTSTLQAVGKSVHVVEMPGGTRVLLLPYGGRVLGLFGAGDDENYYWTNPALATSLSADVFYASADWHNSGGDRTWLAPELDLFFPKYPDISSSGYFQPRQLDPGRYVIEHRNGTVRMVNRLSVALYRAKTNAELEIRKWVTPAANPLRHEKNERLLTVANYAGYTQHTAIAMLGGDATHIGLWNLIQMPHHGEMIIPFYVKTEPRVYFGTIAAHDLRLSDRAIYWRMTAQGEQKIGVRATVATGRVGYRYGSGDSSTLIIRNFVVDPSGEYIDVPWDDAEDAGYSVQACNVSSRWGEFSELEYHVPAIGRGSGRMKCEDVSQVWGFRGPSDVIDQVMATLLCPST